MKSASLAALILMGFVAVTVSSQDLEARKSNESAVSAQNEGRSLEASKSARAGRMLDLDHLAGDIGKDEKLAKDRSQSGQRQSRILSEDLAGKDSKTEARSKKTKGKMSIKGFIPIVSIDQAKDGKHFDGSDLDGDEDESGDEQQSQQHQATNRDQLMSSYGGQTSMGHASFGLQPEHQQQQQQQPAENQWQQASQESARANRKLLGSSGLLGSTLAQHKRFVSSLNAPQASYLQPQMLPHPPQMLQGPMNAPQLVALGAQQPESGGECVCVPFFQCKNGYLSESQLSKSQLHQMSGQFQQQAGNLLQVPRSLNPPAISVQQQQQQQSDLYYTQAPQISSLMSQLESQRQQQAASQLAKGNEQQIANDIYEQLRKRIEMENLEQQFQQQQESQSYAPIDERSKSGSNATLEVEERSLLSPLGRRSSGQQKCGIMRTCCRVPALASHQQAPSFAGPIRHQGARLVGGQQPQFQLLQPLQPQTFQQPDYQVASSNSPPSQQPPFELAGPAAAAQHQRPPSGGFMAGRCGTRQTMGISGRVQNQQLAPGSESSADFGEFPAHAAILRRLSPGDSLFVCSAVLISGQWLATAAHCVRRLRPDELKVRLGEWDVNKDDEFYPHLESNVREIVVHPEFQPTSLVNDVALLRMESPPLDGQQTPHIAPACLATPDEQWAGHRCWLAGWGKDAFGQSGAFQSVLRKVDLPVVGRQECESALRYQTKLGRFFRLHQSAVCAGGERGKDACEGDGGAGLYCTDEASGLTKVVGLVSWGVGCGQRGVPGVYTNVAAVEHWIEAVVQASGEENVYGTPESHFKGLVSERSSQNSTGQPQAQPDKAAESSA